MATFFLGSDHGGVQLKGQLVEALTQRGHAAEDLGSFTTDSVDYPEIAVMLARKVLATEGARGILVCGTGIGMCMTANKVRGIRAALATDPYMARMSVEHNDANVLCLGERVLGPGLAETILDAYLDSTFEGGRHERRVGKIMAAEQG